ncbi:caspase family protein [Asanoa sp. WMMD1127]|uniref:HD domain-containing protein n=1 Tax=Asanoa sp. WMMD1127 TaxID=3016107 RepID=UPI002417EC5E|nr:caspase family protein [Asanoa sp. WMMD1127]MDG4825050.1 caspase family protein [Asanoa sp. WMMD1127]
MPKCDDAAAFAPIPDRVVHDDLTRMRDALLESRYELTILGVTVEERAHQTSLIGEASRNRCLTAIKNVCEAADPGGVVVIYFSGHGIRVGDRDYLVPADFKPSGNAEADQQALISVDVTHAVKDCRARLVVLFVDACRDGGEEIKRHGLGQPLSQLSDGTFVLVSGCEPGRTCGYDPNGGSYFAQGLAEAIGRLNPARTLKEVIVAAGQRLNRYGQKPTARGSHDYFVGSDEIVCDGVATVVEWERAAEQTRLWALIDGAAVGDIAALKKALANRVAELAKEVVRQRDRLRTVVSLVDAWTDDRYPARVLDRLADLLGVGEQHPVILQPEETCALILAPFLRESILALGMYDLSAIDPTDLRQTFGTGLRYELESVYATYDQLCRHVTRLRGDPESESTVIMWMVHRWLAGRQDIWSAPTARTGWVLAATEILAVCRPYSGQGDKEEMADLLHSLAQGVGSAAGARQPDEPEAIGRAWSLRRLAMLAGLLAIDLRRLSRAVPDHVGVRDPVSMVDVRETVAGARWDGPSRRDLRATCRHHAVHVALVDAADEAEKIRRDIAGVPGAKEDDLLRLALATPITGASVHPLSTKADGLAYQVPVPRFSLDSERVRNLLMGTQLYGNRSVALRELYQNALDACRYRNARRRAMYRNAPDYERYPLRIIFRAGVEGGMPYVECEDNGVGMTEYVIGRVFAEAGTRFVHTEAFRREQAQWRQLQGELRLYPNSQFGIGVFSYFMLASEISVWTVPTDEHGATTGSKFEVRIAGSGNLFRIKPTDDVPTGILDGGTVVRLHLAADDSISLEATLRQHLVLPEFPVHVREGDRDVVLAADMLHLDGAHDPLKVERNLWWVSGPGALLADGIKVRKQTDPLSSAPFGYVLDMTGPHRPTLSVDRALALEWDQQWASDSLRNAIPALDRWDGLTLEWLWQLAASEPELADEVVRWLGDRRIPYDAHLRGLLVAVSEVGCFPGDGELSPNRPWYRESRDLARWLKPWRSRIWGELFGMTVDELAPERLDGYPTIQPSDYKWLAAVYGYRAAARVFRRAQGGAIEEVNRQLQQLRRFVIAGMDIRPPGLTSVELEMLTSGSRNSAPMLDDGRLVPAFQEAALTGLSVGQIWREWWPRDDVPAQASDYVPSKVDMLLLTDPSGHSLRALKKWVEDGSASPQEIAEAARSLRRFGSWTLVPSGWDGTVPDVQSAVGRLVAEASRPLSVLDLAAVAGAEGRSVGEVAIEVEDLLVRLGTESAAPDVDAFDDFRPNDLELRLIERVRNARGFVETLAGLLSVALDDVGDPELLVTAIGRIAPVLGLSGEVTTADLVAVTAQGTNTLGAIRDCLESYFAGCLDLTWINNLPPDLGRRTPQYDQAQLLLVNVDGRPRWQAPTPKALVVAAVHQRRLPSINGLLERLALYKEIGAILPAVEVPDDLKIDGRDAVILAEDLITSEIFPVNAALNDRAIPNNLVTPLHLVRSAGRFGWTLEETYDRFVRFAPLGLRMAMSRNACTADVVRWQDLIVLSVGHDGWPPALPPGPITTETVRAAANAIGTDSAFVVGRLRHYATLFGFDLSALEDDHDDS